MTDGRGAFVVNVGSQQSDCSFPDAPQDACLGYSRVVATDTVDPLITGFQRVPVSVVIDNLPTNFYTPDAGVCSSCVAADASGTLYISTLAPLTISDAELDAAASTFKGSLKGQLTNGDKFEAAVSGTTLVGSVAGGTVVVKPESGGVAKATLEVQSLISTESDFGPVKVVVPTTDPITGEPTTVVAYTQITDIKDVVCSDGGC